MESCLQAAAVCSLLLCASLFAFFSFTVSVELMMPASATVRPLTRYLAALPLSLSLPVGQFVVRCKCAVSVHACAVCSSARQRSWSRCRWKPNGRGERENVL